jgi:hypothetical protein
MSGNKIKIIKVINDCRSLIAKLKAFIYLKVLTQQTNGK